MGLREFEDQAGKRWRVWETTPATTAGLSREYREGWLTFDGGAERRRLSPVPPNWEALPSDRLTMLLRVAANARPRDTTLTQIEEERRVSDRRESERRQGERRVGNRGTANGHR
jgi:hypothetical protein